MSLINTRKFSRLYQGGFLGAILGAVAGPVVKGIFGGGDSNSNQQQAPQPSAVNGALQAAGGALSANEAVKFEIGRAHV